MMAGGPFFDGRPKVERGGVRIAILHLLNDEPMHGYQIIQEISERTDGVWNPSPGSVYPTLAQVEDEGLVSSERRDGKNVFSLTDKGRAFVENEAGPAPWELMGSEFDGELIDLRDTAFEVGAALMQVARTGSAEQVQKAKEIIADTKKQIYQLLAGDEAADSDES
jgi:DNA-binding PadR family transcriptional regulator